MEKFELKEGEEYIELNTLIKLLGWVATGGEAKSVIDQEEVKVNGEIETRRRKKLRSGDRIQFGNEQAQIV